MIAKASYSRVQNTKDYDVFTEAEEVLQIITNIFNNFIHLYRATGKYFLKILINKCKLREKKQVRDMTHFDSKRHSYK